MLDGTYRVLREVEVLTFENAEQIDSIVVWVDNDGVIEKMLRPGLRLASFRTDRATAREVFGRHDDSEVKVSVAGSLRDNPEPSQVAFVIVERELAASKQDSGEGSTEDAESSGLVLPSVAHQSVRRIDDGLQVLVTSDGTTLEGFDQDRSGAEDVDTKPTQLIDLGHPAVARLSKSVGELPTSDLATELSHVVRNILSLMPQGVLRPASSVIRAGKGGVVDHAIVLAALLRARQIPARVVFGLTRDRNEPGRSDDRMTLKLAGWVVALVDGQWVSIDPVASEFSRTDQLCLSQPDGDADLKAELSKVFRGITDIDIEIRGARYE